MGFLNSILRSVKREVENDASRKVSNSISSSITGLFNKQGSSNNNTSTPSQGTPAPSNDRYQGFVIGGNSSGGSNYTPANVQYEEDGPVIIDGIDYAQIYDCKLDHFRTILKESFPDMNLREEVPLNEIIPGLNGAYQSVSFLLSQGDTPKVVVQIRYPGQSTREGSKRQCLQHGIGYISLWTNYKNQKEYIEKRVKDALWK